MDGWIKLHRSMTEWEWYQDSNTKDLFIHLLLKANTQDKLWQGNLIKRGQCVSSYSNLSAELGPTIAQIRRAVEKLKSTGELAHLNCGRYGLFTVINYNKYQCYDSHKDTQIADSEQPSDRLVTTTKELKNKKKEKSEYTPSFEEFWKAYPRKTEKANCFEKYGARKKSGVSEVQLLEAAKKYATQCEKDGTPTKFIKHGSTFLSSKEPFKDFIEPKEVEFSGDSREYRLAKFFEDYIKKIDSKFEFKDMQDVCRLFKGLLDSGREPNEIWGVMKALFTGTNNFLIKKYMDVRNFCNEFSIVGSSLTLDGKGGA